MDKIVQALQSKKNLVDQVQLNWIFAGDPQYAVVPAGSNDDMEITQVPREWPVSSRTGFCVKSDSDDDTRKNKNFGAWERDRKKSGSSVQEHDRTPGEGVACDALRRT